jgi:prepilin-type N-terminal cleavage/methylation domain-containing protein/prepilin-type processing-associated H-X9-DG protein
MHKNNRLRQAFTLIELLVVIGIIVLLASLVTPMVSRAIQRARRATCASNLRQIGIAVTGFLVDSRGYYPVSSFSDFRAGPYGLVGILQEHLPFSSLLDHHGSLSEWVDPRHTCPMYYHRNKSYSPGSATYGSYAYRHDFQGAGGSNTTAPEISASPSSLAGRLAGSLRGDRTMAKWSIHHWTPAEYGIAWDNGWNHTSLSTTPHTFNGIPAHAPYFNVLFADGRVSQHRWVHRNGVIPTSQMAKIPPEFRKDEYRADP